MAAKKECPWGGVGHLPIRVKIQQLEVTAERNEGIQL